MRVSALIPLRGGSKSIPLKNIRPIAGMPLCFWALRAAVESSLFDGIYVSTDCAAIAETVTGFALSGVEVVDRPPELASDTSPTEDVMLHLMSHRPFDTLFTLQATSPLTTPDDLRGAYEMFVSGKYDSMLTAVNVKRFFWNRSGQPINYDCFARPRRQDFAGSLMENGAFYITARHVLERCKNRLGGKIGIYEMPCDTAVEIDEERDWEIVERLLLARQQKGVKKL
ncbi:MAG: acylneuraminate cytidylyltransferase family protein [Synergistaceae bacterium]|jgi:N-acylneuraminate cytidylyltransferase|nr:acylneuraminate cytidylyltransferase family protein [Synergistaceae bacterium]